MGAEGGKLAHHITARPLAEGRQHYHGGHADGHRQQHQAGAQACAAQGGDGVAQAIG